MAATPEDPPLLSNTWSTYTTNYWWSNTQSESNHNYISNIIQPWHLCCTEETIIIFILVTFITITLNKAYWLDLYSHWLHYFGNCWLFHDQNHPHPPEDGWSTLLTLLPAWGTLATMAVRAPNLAAITHWLAPLPPNPFSNIVPWIVSPGLGSRGV